MGVMLRKLFIQLSASDRDGGISNYDYGHDVEASVTVDTERVCVSYLNRLRCHDL